MKQPLTYQRLAVFFLPLAATPLMIASTHTIANAVLARLPFPVLSLAVFSVVQAMTNTLKAPVLLTKETTVSLVDNRASLALVARFAAGLALLFCLLLVSIAYTPLGEWFFRTVMGLQDPDSVAFAYAAMRIACFLPLVKAFRNFFQGLAIGVRSTAMVSFGTGFRLVVISLISLWAVRTQSYPGVVIGAFIWTAGIGMEGLLLAAVFLSRYRSPVQAVKRIQRRSDRRLTMLQVLAFFLPLGAMMVMNTSLQPLIQGIIARSPVGPTEALASYGVAWGLLLIISGPLNMLHQVSLVFARQPVGGDWATVRRFCLFIGFCVSLGALVVGLSPLGVWVMTVGIGVAPSIAEQARWVLVSFTLFPVFRAWQELYWGLLMGTRRTSVIGVGKVLNLATALVVLTLAVAIPSVAVRLPAAVAGGLAFSLGQGVESTFLWQYTKHQLCPETEKDSRQPRE